MNDKICELIGRLANAPQVFIYRRMHRRTGHLQICGVYGFNVTSLPGFWHLPELDSDKNAAIACRHCEKKETLQDHPLRKMVPAATTLFAARLPVESDDSSTYLVAINPESALFDDDERLTALTMLVQMLVPRMDASVKEEVHKRNGRAPVLAQRTREPTAKFSLALA